MPPDYFPADFHFDLLAAEFIRVLGEFSKTDRLAALASLDTAEDQVAKRIHMIGSNANERGHTEHFAHAAKVLRATFLAAREELLKGLN